MMSSTLGAPLGGTTRGGQYGFESRALSLITPPNGIGGAGICFPSIVTVALGEPGVPVICWAAADVRRDAASSTAAAASATTRFWIDVCLMAWAPLLTSRRSRRVWVSG